MNIRASDPSDLGRETLDMVFLTLEDLLGDEHGEVSILDAHLLDFFVEPVYTTPSAKESELVE